MIRAFLTEERPLKLLALLLAVTLFVIVRGDKDAVTSGYVKVVYVLPDNRVLVSDPVDEVRVSVRGPWTRVQRFDEREIEPIRVDLTHASGSTVRFTEDMVKLPAGLRVASIRPPEVKVEFDPRMVRAVTIRPVVEGDPADGFHVLKVTARPAVVRLDGAKGVVEGLRSAPTKPLHIAGARAPVRGEVSLEPPPRHSHFVDVKQVAVDADVEPALLELMLDGVPVHVSGATRLSSEVAPQAVQLVLRGPADTLRRVQRSDISVTVDVQLEDGRPPGSYRKRVSVTGLPRGIAAEIRPDTVLLSTHRRRD